MNLPIPPTTEEEKKVKDCYLRPIHISKLGTGDMYKGKTEGFALCCHFPGETIKQQTQIFPTKWLGFSKQENKTCERCIEKQVEASFVACKRS